MKRLLEIEERLRASTPGPWYWVDRNGYSELVSENGRTVLDDGSACGEYGPEIESESADAQLVAYAPTDIRDLLKVAKIALPLLRHYWLNLDDRKADDAFNECCRILSRK